MLEINSISVIIFSNLVSSESEKKKQQLEIFKPWLWILLLYQMIWWQAKWEPMHICKHEAIRSLMMAEMKKCPKKHIHKTAKSKPTSNKLEEKNWFFWKCIIFAIIC